MMAGFGVLAALISIVFGAITCFYGFRIFRIVLAFVGFLIGFGVGAALVGNNQVVLQIIVGLVGGVIGAAVFYALYFVGVLLAGAAFGALVGTALASVLNASSGTSLILLVVGLVVGAILALVLNKLVIVLATAFGGAGGIVQGLAVLLPGVFGSAVATQSGVFVSASPLGFVVWIVLGLAGVIVQYRQNKNKLVSAKPSLSPV
jgi:hypothetical protein